MSLKFNLIKTDGNARRGSVETAHGIFQTPAFMAVGTAATVKALTMDQVAATGTEVILGNTYHLMLRPGGDLVEKIGGLHEFSGWHGPILTDSGGFQIKSLAGWGCGGESQEVTKTDGGLVKMTEEGVHFTSHVDGGIKHFLTPEKSVQIQHQLDSNITMALDECLPYPVARDVVEKNVGRVTRWARRSFDAFVDRPGYGIFGIVQGSVFKDMRDLSIAGLTQIPFDGFAIGSLTQGEPYDVMLDIIAHTTDRLPADKPRYLMGAGTPLDILGAVERGIDMFDCVMPTRAGRTAQAFTRSGTMNLRNAKFTDDAAPLDDKCGCPACRLSRAYIHHLVKCGEMLGATLLTQHNLWFYQDLMRDIRASIERGDFAEFKKNFTEKYTGQA
ncbi:MAG: tRNA guanosine(34) transglycosylase Tgt [Rickettsiales bacterium]|jgi:queuine tRNA-ribosyltransferase|nr:tRNA guanosine(34) transglycosylase Tgt [Rickettsiales bacterium]